MIWLILGLAVFLGVHCIRMVAPAWRDTQMARMGALSWKAVYSLLSLLGFALLIYGYAEARQDALILWRPPAWTHQLAVGLMLLAFVLMVAAYVPGNRIKAIIGHPMLAGVKVWAFAHLISNGALPEVILFGAFLLWSVLEFRTFRRRDRAAGITYPRGPLSRDYATVVLGVAAYLAFVKWLHVLLIGVQPY